MQSLEVLLEQMYLSSTTLFAWYFIFSLCDLTMGPSPPKLWGFNLPLTFCQTNSKPCLGKQGGEWGMQAESINEESQVRGCYNLTFIYTNQETV